MDMNKRRRPGRLLVAAAALMIALAGAADAALAAQETQFARTQTDRATQLLFEAIHTNDFASAEAAVAAGASVEVRNRWNVTPIELAIDKGYFRIAHFLVSVRNSRRQSEIAITEPTPPAIVEANRPKEVRSSTVPFAPGVADEPAVAWPSDQPDPFDPATPAFGTRLPVVDSAAE